MTAEQLYIKYGLVDRKKDFEIIDFFEGNALMIQNLEEDGEIHVLTTKMILLSDYAYAAANNGQREKSIPLLIEAIRLHEKHQDFEKNKKESRMYEYLIFSLAESFYKVKKINDSKETFIKLARVAPDNETYRTWIIETTNYTRREMVRYIFISFTIWLLISVLFRVNIPKQFDLFFAILGMTLFITWTVLEILNYITKRKYGRNYARQQST